VNKIIKNKSLIDRESSETSPKVYTLKKYSLGLEKEKIIRLSHVFHYLPSGLVHKEETGMGATTLELKCKRNSIIVEPIKITASSKAYKHSRSSSKRVLYVGSETSFHPQKISKSAIERYAHDPKIKFKKIIVVADSLYRVIDAIGENVFEDYFLLIDEADSFQMDSTFRRSMEECFSYYKKFEAHNRCLLSSTLLDFSDPDLVDEPKTVIKYNQPFIREIDVIFNAGKNLLGAAIERIRNIHTEKSKDKILIAYNSVSGCFDIAEHLVKEKITTRNKISILCSQNSKSKVNVYFKELESDKLPNQINFITSAYFTGFDLNEPYHLIAISENKRVIHSLSDKRLKQIAGRCRKKLFSETIIHDLVPLNSKIVEVTKEELIEAANIQLDSLKCIEKQYNKSRILKQIYFQVTDTLINSLEKNDSQFVRINSNTNQAEISYLNIDATLELNRTRFSLYTNYNSLFNKLKEDGHQVNFIFSQNEEIVENLDAEKQDRITKIESMISLLRNINNEDDLYQLEGQRGFDALQKKILKNFMNLYGYIDSNQILDKISEVSQKRDSRELNHLMWAATYSIMSDDNLYKNRINTYLKVGSRYSPEEIRKRLNLSHMEANISTHFKTNRSAVNYIKRIFKCKRYNDCSYSLISTNPRDLNILKLKNEHIDFLKEFE
jgi:hypothetical protein